MPSSLISLLKARLAAGEIEADAAQLAVAERLDALARELATRRPVGRWSLGSLFGSRSNEPVRGLYIHGSVGRGKTMLMDLFYGAVEVNQKRRIHFHEFMVEVHDRIAVARKSTEGDPLPRVAANIAQTTRLLCFDELHVTDIADAMILGRLFKGLFEAGVVMVATSNAHPRDLYRNGLNRQLFLPSIDLIEKHMDVVELKSAKDFRLEKLAGQPLYFIPADASAHKAIRAAFQHLTGVSAGQPLALDVKGRTVMVPEAAQGVARFSFSDLCSQPLGSLDYLHIAHAFHTVLIENVPVLTPPRRNEARRFINLIDTLYDNRIGLIMSADAEPHELYVEGDGADLFERTASRLIEMRSEAYLQQREGRTAVPA
jgi:cell division protein ZapE